VVNVSQETADQLLSVMTSLRDIESMGLLFAFWALFLLAAGMGYRLARG
jgi:hypothetical protein